MTSRFVSNLLVLGVSMTLVAFSLVFSAPVLGWLGLGLGAVVVVVVVGAFVVRGRGLAQRILDVLVALTGGWLIVASRCFSGAPLKWICFGTSCLLVLLALVGLVVHEISMELALRPLARESEDGRGPARRREHATAR